MLNQVYYETKSVFDGAFFFTLRLFLWIVISILRIVIPIALFGIVLIGKGVILCASLLCITFWKYWWNIDILQNRLRHVQGFYNFLNELRIYGFATEQELNYQANPFSVSDEVKRTRFYYRFIAFVDRQNTDQITIQNVMSLSWLAQVMDKGLTFLVKLAIPVAIEISNLIFIPINAIMSAFD